MERVVVGWPQLSAQGAAWLTSTPSSTRDRTGRTKVARPVGQVQESLVSEEGKKPCCCKSNQSQISQAVQCAASAKQQLRGKTLPQANTSWSSTRFCCWAWHQTARNSPLHSLGKLFWPSSCPLPSCWLQEEQRKRKEKKPWYCANTVHQ